MGWSKGDTIVRRDLWHGRPWYAVACVVVEDGDWLVTYAPPGAESAAPTTGALEFLDQMATGHWRLQTTRRFNHTLAFATPGDSHSIIMFWNDAWQFLGWYINLEEPFLRTAIGVDTCDWHLDVVLDANGRTWRWKDEDHIQRALELGLFAEADVDEMRREARTVVDDFLCGAPPFTQEWVRWRPNPQWPVPALPRGWDDL